MRKTYSILSRVLLGGALILALMPLATCRGDGMAMGKKMNCPNASCCQNHHGCHHQNQKECQRLVKAPIEGVFKAKSVRPEVCPHAVPIPHLTVSALGQYPQVFKQFYSVQSPPGSLPVLRI